MGHNYIDSERTLNLYLDIKTKNEDDINFYKEAMLSFIELIHEEVKVDFLNDYFNLNKSHKKNYARDVKYINTVIQELETMQFKTNNNMENDINNLYRIRANLHSIYSYLEINDKFLSELNSKKDFNLILINNDPEFISVKKDVVNSKLIYLLALFFSFLLYVIYLLILLGFRNR